jgi:methionyl-tRNA synthetase
MDSLRIHEALEGAMELARAANGYVEESEPWTLAKDPERASDLDRALASMVRALVVLTALFVPVMPEKMSQMAALLGLSHIPKLDDAASFPIAGLSVSKGVPLFPRIEVEG